MDFEDRVSDCLLSRITNWAKWSEIPVTKSPEKDFRGWGEIKILSMRVWDESVILVVREMYGSMR